jgi:redox-sensitive bicupin YhaK (pirin superfamily)
MSVEPPSHLEVSEARSAMVGTLPVRRALPNRRRRTVGAWCFVDHMGPAPVTPEHGVDIGPHPHIGLQTATWLVAGEVLHRDSLGSEQVIRPGQLNLMTAGNGVVHAEERTGRYRGDLHGVQLWIAQPDATRHGPAAFEHHADLPRAEVAGGVATVLVGEMLGARSPARRDTDHVGAELALHTGRTELPLDPAFEHALVVLHGAATVDGHRLEPGHLAYLGGGRSEATLAVDGPTIVLLIGGLPFEATPFMWWNFVARTRDEIDAAYRAWRDGDERFGPVASALAPIPVGPPPWLAGRP